MSTAVSTFAAAFRVNPFAWREFGGRCFCRGVFFVLRRRVLVVLVLALLFFARRRRPKPRLFRSWSSF